MNDQAEEYVDRQKSKDDDYISYSLLKMVKKIPAKLAHTWTIRLSTVTAAHGLAGEPSSQSLGRGADDDSEDSDEDCDEDSDGPVEEAEQKGNQLEAGIVARIGGKRCCFIRPRALLYWLCVCVCVCLCIKNYFLGPAGQLGLKDIMDKLVIWSCRASRCARLENVPNRGRLAGY